MKKELLYLLPTFIIFACQLNDHIVDSDLKDVPISGTVYNAATGKPLKDVRVVLRQCRSNGLFSIPTCTYPGDIKTNDDGHFEFKPSTSENLDLIFSCDELFDIDGDKFPKYGERYVLIDEYNRTNLKIGLTPNAVLSINFKTDNPLKEKEYVNFNSECDGSSYSKINLPPLLRKTICKGNQVNTITWTIKRIGHDAESFHDEITVKAFTKGEYVINY